MKATYLVIYQTQPRMGHRHADYRVTTEVAWKPLTRAVCEDRYDLGRPVH